MNYSGGCSNNGLLDGKPSAVGPWSDYPGCFLALEPGAIISRLAEISPLLSLGGGGGGSVLPRDKGNLILAPELQSLIYGSQWW